MLEGTSGGHAPAQSRANFKVSSGCWSLPCPAEFWVPTRMEMARPLCVLVPVLNPLSEFLFLIFHYFFFAVLLIQSSSIVFQLHFIPVPVSILLPLRAIANILFPCFLNFLLYLYFFIETHPFDIWAIFTPHEIQTDAIWVEVRLNDRSLLPKAIWVIWIPPELPKTTSYSPLVLHS